MVQCCRIAVLQAEMIASGRVEPVWQATPDAARAPAQYSVPRLLPAGTARVLLATREWLKCLYRAKSGRIVRKAVLRHRP
jgi:hypothetical protein